MKRISFKDSGGLNLTQAVLSGQKTMTRRAVPYRVETEAIEYIYQHSPYKIGDVVAIQQAYIAIKYSNMSTDMRNKLERSAGFTNKMFVRASLMPNHIRITDVRVERLQDISDDDCLREGIAFSNKHYCKYGIIRLPFEYDEPREAFAALIDKVSGRGTWESNPLVWAYSFELVY